MENPAPTCASWNSDQLRFALGLCQPLHISDSEFSHWKWAAQSSRAQGKVPLVSVHFFWLRPQEESACLAFSCFPVDVLPILTKNENPKMPWSSVIIVQGRFILFGGYYLEPHSCSMIIGFCGGWKLSNLLRGATDSLCSAVLWEPLLTGRSVLVANVTQKERVGLLQFLLPCERGKG